MKSKMVLEVEPRLEPRLERCEFVETFRGEESKRT